MDSWLVVRLCSWALAGINVSRWVGGDQSSCSFEKLLGNLVFHDRPLWQHILLSDDPTPSGATHTPPDTSSTTTQP